jgi:hypothetical protein
MKEKKMDKNICVFCSSSNTLSKEYYKDAELLGKFLAKNGFNLVYGGSNVGTMYSVAKSAKENGAKIYGVMPKKLYNFGVYSKECDEFFLTDDMRSRKTKLDELSDGIIAMAGGFGTLEETSEILCHKQLGYNNKPIVFLNTNGFYDNLFEFFENIVKESFAKQTALDLYYVASSPRDAVEYLLGYDYTPKEIRPEDIYTYNLSK